MIELELVGIHNDGETVVLIDATGSRYRLVIDDALRAAVRRDRPQLEQLRSVHMRPREIQVLIRAGATAAEVADQGGLPIEQVRRYEGPVLAERAHVANRSQALLVGRETGAPTLGDLVVDRLAARGIAQVEWDARRRDSDPWEVVASYEDGDVTQQAAWQVDLAAQSFRALDEAARLLSEIDLAAAPRRHLSAVPAARVYDVEHDGDIQPVLRTIDDDLNHGHPQELESGARPEPAADTEAILAELAAARGVRQQLSAPDHEEPTLWDDVSRPGRETTGSASTSSADGPPGTEAAPAEGTDGARGTGGGPDRTDGPGEVVALPRPESEPVPDPEPAPAKRRSRSRRTSVPSWDEIVFGAKND
ncbi:DUF3071 domain-containing protein [Pseudactinotalea sp. HY160]|uniref:septation protein SepH n=1 Tax=Pseudactinotalea sp. HY160 TaxID=2654490 RepID=UPI00128E4346|nr:septation protein SepH [Pseudactinotalea sp. HY160]MPV49419.1 DUF3071 domain-containing protein [Pseudactinotalea sp. HY160]